MVEIVKQNYLENKEIYNKIRDKIIPHLNTNMTIEHVGSTAIPDMYGKNIIDILIGVENTAQFISISSKLTNLGFIPSQKSKDDIYQFFSSTVNETGAGDVHIHLVIRNTERYNEFIVLRDYLLKNNEEAKKYSDFKKEIVQNNITDRKQYKTIKSEYVTALIERAKKCMKES